MEFMEPLEILWDYLSLHQEPEKADVIVGFGCYDDNVARWAAQLYQDGYAPKILFTGGLGRNTTGLFTVTEAEKFARVAMDCGVPEGDILLEGRSTNTKENIEFTRALLEEKKIPHCRILGVHKHYMERRIFSAMGAYWPQQAFSVTSFPQTLAQALETAKHQGMTEENTISTIVGDFQRIDLYAKKGYQLPQVIPEEAWEAYRKLIALGYDTQLAK